MKCLKCGNEIAEGDVFCENCGEKIDWENKTVSKMKYVCPFCGSVFPEAPEFCPQCGTRQEIHQESDSDTQVDSYVGKNQKTAGKGASAHGTGLMKKGIIAVIIILALIGGTFIGLKVFGPKTYDLNKYMTYKTEGHDGFGTCSVKLDTETISKDMAETVAKRIKKDKIRDDEWELDLSESEMEELITDYDLAEDWVTVSIDKEEEISNGDKITISYEYNNEELKKFGIKFKGKEKTITIKDLPEVEILDVFKDLNLEFSGVSPNVYTDESSTANIKGATVSYTCEPYENLKIGDEVEVTVTDISEGYKAKKTKGKVKVRNVDDSTQSTDDLSSEERNSDASDGTDTNDSGEKSKSSKKKIKTYLYSLGDGSAISQTASFNVRASSTLKEEDFNHDVSALSDDDDNTCWSEGADGEGIGETVTFTSDVPQKVNALYIKPGFWKTEELFYKNGCPTKLKITCGDTVSEVDISGFQYKDGGQALVIKLDDIYEVNKCIVEIEDVRSGNTYQDTCITELYFTNIG